jgi:hypothetical protein
VLRKRLLAFLLGAGLLALEGIGFVVLSTEPIFDEPAGNPRNEPK